MKTTINQRHSIFTFSFTLIAIIVASSLLLSACEQQGTIAGSGTPTATPTPAGISAARAGLTTIHMIDTLSGWAASDTAIFRTIDGGAHWLTVTPKNTNLQAQGQGQMRVSGSFLTASIAWVVAMQVASSSTPPVYVYRTTDAGQTWQMATLPEDVALLVQITFIDSVHGWIQIGKGAAAGSTEVDVFRTTDAGQTWVKVSGTDIYGNKPGEIPFGGDKTGLSFADVNTGWEASYTNASDYVELFVTHDGGQTWHQQAVPVQHGTQTMYETNPPIFLTAQDGFLPVTIVSADGNSNSLDLYVTHNQGATWQSTTSIPTVSATQAGFSFINIHEGWATNGNALYATNDAAQHWTKINASKNFQGISGLDFVTSTVGWAIGYTSSGSSFLLKTTDGGQTWR